MPHLLIHPSVDKLNNLPSIDQFNPKSIHKYLYMTINSSISSILPSIHQLINPPIHQSAHPSIHKSIHTHLPTRQSDHQSNHRSIDASVRQSITSTITKSHQSNHHPKPSNQLHVGLAIHPLILQPTHPNIHPSTPLLVHLPVYLFIYSSVSLLFCLFIHHSTVQILHQVAI